MSDERPDPHKDDPPCFVDKDMHHSGNFDAWSVEARIAMHSPKTIAGHLLDDRWRRVNYNYEPVFGVPIGKDYHEPLLRTCGVMGYACAQAMRWWLVAVAERDCKHVCLETRLVKHEIQYQFSNVAKSAHEWRDCRPEQPTQTPHQQER